MIIDKTYLIILKQKTKMRKILTYAVSALALASCSSDSLVSDSPVNNEAPIAFNVGQKNITRTTNLEDAGYNDFGVWAYKVKNGEPSFSALVMGNYKVAHTAAAGETPASWDYVGKVDGQVTRYWDYSTDSTNFYAYAPYASATEFNATNKTITVSSTAGYDAKNDVIYAGKSVDKENGYGKNVPLQFKHIGAKVNIAFRENVAGYKVQLIDVKDNTEAGKGIQLTPAVNDDTKTALDEKYTKGEYNEKSNVTISYTKPDAPTTNATAKKTSNVNLIFALPTKTELSESDYEVSTTTYYAVVQSDNNPGFTLHVSYKLIAEDNNEEIIVRDARVFIPANMVKWESNKAYTYNFTITTTGTGNTDGTVDVDSPIVPTDKALNPIVFDNPTISDYEAANPYNEDI
ncbi:fimbrillin family protein [Prevotella sp. RM4]|uniref:fimbrillin family protein n=1 Tax=Prevotella sp. RM4 TaxID=1200547 RepID=UPI0018DBCC89|nr:fimbrillin family protein [Prevotella sp. RM4]